MFLSRTRTSLPLAAGRILCVVALPRIRTRQTTLCAPNCFRLRQHLAQGAEEAKCTLSIGRYSNTVKHSYTTSMPYEGQAKKGKRMGDWSMAESG
ncbi:hypothetical protein BDV06DRAFT_198117 [Aspergillus oleicola]